MPDGRAEGYEGPTGGEEGAAVPGTGGRSAARHVVTSRAETTHRLQTDAFVTPLHRTVWRHKLIHDCICRHDVTPTYKTAPADMTSYPFTTGLFSTGLQRLRVYA